MLTELSSYTLMAFWVGKESMGHDTVPYLLNLQNFVILLLKVSPFLQFKFFVDFVYIWIEGLKLDDVLCPMRKCVVLRFLNKIDLTIIP